MSSRSTSSLLALLAAVAGLGSSGASPDLPVAPSPIASDFADPFVLRDGDAHYAFATGTRGQNVQVTRSTDLVTWSTPKDALPSLPAWASSTGAFTWAPSVLRRGGSYILYYTTRDRRLDHQCISRAIAARPEGPYVDASTAPFVCQAALCGSIDPSPFVDAAGDAYLLWKSDENDRRCNGVPRLWGQRLSADALDVTGPAVPLLAMDRAWERPLVEGPSMTANDGRFHLFYSANWYESASYAVGHARCDSPLGPCTKTTIDAPLFASTHGFLGPGGQEIFDDGRGSTFVAFHAWTAPNASYGSGGARSLRIGRLRFEAGTPVIDPGPVVIAR